jgi:uncharacterized protein
MANPVTHWQILTTKPQELEEFYSNLFGWSMTSDNPLGYKTVDTNSADGIGGGLWPIDSSQGHSMVQLFVRVDDLNETVSRAEQLGGKVVIPIQKLPSGDEMAVVVDPDGIPVGMFKGAGSAPQ